MAEVMAQTDEALPWQLQDELHAVQTLNRRQRAASEAERLAGARRELRGTRRMNG